MKSLAEPVFNREAHEVSSAMRASFQLGQAHRSQEINFSVYERDRAEQTEVEFRELIASTLANLFPKDIV